MEQKAPHLTLVICSFLFIEEGIHPPVEARGRGEEEEALGRGLYVRGVDDIVNGGKVQSVADRLAWGSLRGLLELGWCFGT